MVWAKQVSCYSLREGLGLAERHVPRQLQGLSLPYSHGPLMEPDLSDHRPWGLLRLSQTDCAEGGSQETTELCMPSSFPQSHHHGRRKPGREGKVRVISFPL